MSRQSKVIKELKASTIFLKESRTEAYDHIVELQEELDQVYAERKYMHDFINSKGLLEEFYHFQKHAHLDTDSELPFPSYIL